VLGAVCSSKNLSIEIFDSGHRKIPFVDGVDSHQIGQRPDRVESDSALIVRVHKWKDEHHEGQSEETRRQESRSEEAGRQEEEEVVISQ
jgi:hypothetical protein